MRWFAPGQQARSLPCGDIRSPMWDSGRRTPTDHGDPGHSGLDVPAIQGQEYRLC